MILSGALDGHPRLKLLSGHWGEFVAGWLDRLDEVVSTWDPQTTHSGGTGWATDRLAPNVIHRRAVPVSHVAVSHGGCQRRTTLNRPDNLYFVVDREM